MAHISRQLYIKTWKPTEGMLHWRGVSHVTSGKRLADLSTFNTQTVRASILQGCTHHSDWPIREHIVFINDSRTAGLISFSMPLVQIKQAQLKKHWFSMDEVVGRIQASSNGGWQGETYFSLSFNKGGAYEFAHTLTTLLRRVQQGEALRRAPHSPALSGQAAVYYKCPPAAYRHPHTDRSFRFVAIHAAFKIPENGTLHYAGAAPPYAGVISHFGIGWEAIPPRRPSATGDTVNEADGAVSDPCTVLGGYYFQQDPHTIYVLDSIPPPQSSLPTSSVIGYPVDGAWQSSFVASSPAHSDQQAKKKD